jgi:hypothetical protein
MTDKADNRFYREAGGHEAWRAAFDERHEFDVYPDHFMTGMRNEFCAGWHAALKGQAASQPKVLTDEQVNRALAAWFDVNNDPRDAEVEDRFRARFRAAYAALLEAAK